MPSRLLLLQQDLDNLGPRGALHRGFPLLGRGRLITRQGVHVDVGSYEHTGVAEQLGNYGQRNAYGQQLRTVGVPEAVEGNARKAGPLREPADRLRLDTSKRRDGRLPSKWWFVLATTHRIVVDDSLRDSS